MDAEKSAFSPAGITLPLVPPSFSQSETFTSPISTGTSTSGPMAVANAAYDVMLNTAMATAIVSSKLLDARVNESKADFP
jgi:hypothetical protein